MSQDTRKDKRAKVVSLNVRYKSATVDEFIENHSHDVSKGGVFIKTPNAFPPGTLLKFEIRIAGDKAVIVGVGRGATLRFGDEPVVEQPSEQAVQRASLKLDAPVGTHADLAHEGIPMSLAVEHSEEHVERVLFERQEVVNRT